VNDGKTIDKIAYTNCAAATLLYRVNGGNHGWPGGTKGRAKTQESDPPTQALNASETIWNFFASI
jgi:poly(3-hydroxybutyrate) depolymerase